MFEKLIETENLIEDYLHSESTKSEFYYKDSKATFEEAYESTAKKFMTDPDIRKSIMDETEKQVKADGLGMPPDFSYEFIAELALRHRYAQFKKAFEFE